MVAGSLVLGAAVLKGPVHGALVAAGLLPEPHPLARDIRTVTFLRDLDLDPAAILGPAAVAAVDRALARPAPAPVRRGSLRQALALALGRSIRSQAAFATQ